MTQVGDGARPAEKAAGATILSASVGDILAERYRLEQHINNDNAGREVWRGVDTVLRRPVAVVLRQPGGAAAEEMLAAAVTASRVVHPNLIGVYDAIDEELRAYVVREWIDGSALRDLVQDDGPFDAERTTSTLHAVADAVSALHESGMAHGNIHPGTVLVGDDGRVVLSDARADVDTSREADIRSLGALAYFMLTSTWPREVGRTALPDTRRDNHGLVTSPRLIRAGVPSYLDDLVMDLLNPELALPTAQVLSGELARLDTGEQMLFGGAGTLRFADNAPEVAKPPATSKIVAAGGVALALVITGMVLGIKALNAGNAATTPPIDTVASTPSTTQTDAPAKPRVITLRPDQVRIVDPNGDRDETEDAALVVDGNPKTIWKMNWYSRSNFGGSKPGMGILIKLDKAEEVASVLVQLTAKGATAELRAGDADQPDTTVGDKAINTTYKRISGPLEKHEGTTMVFTPGSDTAYRYLLIWLTDLPLESPGKFRVGVQEIVVEVQ